MGKTVTIDDVVVDETEARDEGASVETSVAGAVVIDDDSEGETKKTVLPSRALRNEDGSVTLPLVKAVSYKVKTATSLREEMVKELTFHELNGADLRIMAQQSDDMKGVVAFARSTRIPTNRMTVIFDKLGSRDIKAGGDIISFLSE